VAPLIIATDKTQLTQFSGNKQAYPVYLTLGNIPKSIRRKPSQRACILLAYLPVEKIASKDDLTRKEISGRHQRLFHDALRHIFAPLIEAGKTGVEMTSGDGAVRKVYPIIASYVADFPEQCLVTCSKYGTCPKCQVKAAELGNPDPGNPRTKEWTLGVMQKAREKTESPAQYFEYCKKCEVSGYVFRPFWQDLPFTDLHVSMTPDVLHQLYQGVLSHLVKWCTDILGDKELDRRIRLLPPAYGVRHFKNGISGLAQITGTERKNMGKILLGCLVGSTTVPTKVITAVRAILDFIYLAQYSTQDDDTLSYISKALQLWEANKDVFISLDTHPTLNIPKFHSLHHYITSIRFFGATDNYNTEMFERLHIDFAKKGWRASNKRDEFPQMTKWLSRQENVESFQRELSWVLEQQKVTGSSMKAALGLASNIQTSSTSPPQPSSRILLPKHPTFPMKSISAITEEHDVPLFPKHLRQFLAMSVPGAKIADVKASEALPIAFNHLDVFYSFKFSRENLDEAGDLKDMVKASPRKKRFDTVVVLTGDKAETVGFHGTRIGRVKVLFRLPTLVKMMNGALTTPAPSYWPQNVLAYIEWYTPLTLTTKAEEIHNMASVQKISEGVPGQTWSIIPISNIRQSCMLIPKFDKHPISSQRSWKSDNVLDSASHFLINNWASIYSYQSLYKEYEE
jgi:hypothetical protein